MSPTSPRVRTVDEEENAPMVGKGDAETSGAKDGVRARVEDPEDTVFASPPSGPAGGRGGPFLTEGRTKGKGRWRGFRRRKKRRHEPLPGLEGGGTGSSASDDDEKFGTKRKRDYSWCWQVVAWLEFVVIGFLVAILLKENALSSFFGKRACRQTVVTPGEIKLVTRDSVQTQASEGPPAEIPAKRDETPVEPEEELPPMSPHLVEEVTDWECALSAGSREVFSGPPRDILVMADSRFLPWQKEHKVTKYGHRELGDPVECHRTSGHTTECNTKHDFFVDSMVLNKLYADEHGMEFVYFNLCQGDHKESMAPAWKRPFIMRNMLKDILRETGPQPNTFLFFVDSDSWIRQQDLYWRDYLFKVAEEKGTDVGKEELGHVIFTDEHPIPSISHITRNVNAGVVIVRATEEAYALINLWTTAALDPQLCDEKWYWRWPAEQGCMDKILFGNTNNDKTDTKFTDEPPLAPEFLRNGTAQILPMVTFNGPYGRMVQHLWTEHAALREAMFTTAFGSWMVDGKNFSSIVQEIVDAHSFKGPFCPLTGPAGHEPKRRSAGDGHARAPEEKMRPPDPSWTSTSWAELI